MFSSAPRFDANKCKVNLKMLANRFKLLENKKANLNKQANRSVAGLLREGKSESARIQVEHIIREDYTVELYEVLRQHVEIMLARFSVVQNEPEPRKEVQESVCTIIYSGWLLGSEISELRALYEQLQIKYGKPFVEEVTRNPSKYINPRVVQKLQHDIPDPKLVETYLVEIARAHRVDWVPSLGGVGVGVPKPIDLAELDALRAADTSVAATAPAVEAAPVDATAIDGAPSQASPPAMAQLPPPVEKAVSQSPQPPQPQPQPQPQPAVPLASPPFIVSVTRPRDADDELMRRLAALKSR